MSPLQKVIKYFAMGLAAFIMVGILSAIVAVVSGVGSGFDSFEDNRNFVSFTKEYENVKNLDISNDEKKLTIVSGDTNQVIVEAKNVPETLEVNVTSDGTLVIEDKNRFHITWLFGWTHDGYRDMEINITIPRDFSVDRVRLDAGSGKMEVADITAQNFLLDGGSGSFTAKNLSAQKASLNLGSGSSKFEYVEFSKGDFECGSGDVKIQDAIFTDMEFNSGSGSISYSGQLFGKTSLDGGSGRATFELEGNRADYSFDCEAGSGGIWIDGDKEEELKENNTAANEIEIDGGSGRVVVDFY